MHGQLRIDITDNCNIRCIMCMAHSYSSPSEVNFLNFDLFRKQTKGQLRYWDTIQLGMIGEPTIHPQFADFIQFIRSESPATINICTNGSLIDRYADVINKCRCSLQVSTDSLIDETHEYIRYGSNFKKLRNNLQLLDLSYVNVLLAFAMMRSNIDENDKILDFCAQHQYNVGIFPMELRISYGAIIPYNVAWESLWFCKEKIRNWLKKYYGKDYNKMIKSAASGTIATDISAQNCMSHETDLFINARGDSLLCYMEPLPNISDMSLTEIWNSPQAIKFRRKIDINREPCMKCNYLRRCLIPSFSDIENHFCDDIISQLTPSTREAIAYESTVPDEEQFRFFLEDISKKIDIYLFWHDKKSYNATLLRNFKYIVPPKDMIEHVLMNTTQEIIKGKTPWGVFKKISPTNSIKGGPKFIDHYKGYNIVKYKKRYWGVPSGRSIDLNAPQEILSNGIFKGETIELIKEGIKKYEEENTPILVNENVQGYNIVKHLNSFLAVPTILGVLDLTVSNNREKPGIIKMDMLEDLIQKIESLPENYTLIPLLLESNYYGYNIVAYLNSYLGVPVTLGVLNMSLQENRDKPEILQYNSVEELRDFIKFTNEYNFPEPNIIEKNYYGYNLYGFDNKFYAIPIPLEPLDLKDTTNLEKPGILKSTLYYDLRKIACESPYPKRHDSNFEGYSIWEYRNIFYGIPLVLGVVNLNDENDVSHKSVIKMTSIEKVKEAIIISEDDTLVPVHVVKYFHNYNIFSYRGTYIAVPCELGALDITKEETLNMLNVFQSSSLEELKEIVFLHVNNSSSEVSEAPR